MAQGFVFEDNTIKIMEAIPALAQRLLEECGGELESAIKRNNRVDTGETKNSWQHKVTTMGNEYTCTIGSDDKNAIWEEYGTGEYALEGKGRHGSWLVPVDSYHGRKKPTFGGKVVIVYGKNGTAFYKTNGKRPHRPGYNAYNSLRDKLIKRMQDEFRREMS